MEIKKLRNLWDKIFDLKISEDNVTAYLTLFDLSTTDISEEGEEAHFLDETYDVDGILEYLNEQKIIYGIQTERIQQAIEEHLYYVPLIVAVGKEAESGRDGYYEFNFNTEPEIKPIILEDGSVDYNKLGKMELVDIDDLLAIYHPAIPGIDGTDIYGKVIMPKKQKELSLLRGKGFHTIEKEGTIEYYSDVEGKAEYKDGSLIVSPVFIVKEDVDATINEITFNGDVWVMGNVSAHATIRATGNINVDGHVESAALIAGKNILLKNGMQGAGRSYVYAKGDISAKFFEQTMVIAEGNIFANAMMNCEVQSNKSILISGKHGIIIGGVVRAVEKIEAYNIGNKAKAFTSIHVGVESSFQSIVSNLDERILELRDRLCEVEIEYQRMTGKMEKNPEVWIHKRNASMREKINCQASLNALIKWKKNLIDQRERSIEANIKVRKTMYTNTEVGINNVTKVFTSDCDNVTLREKKGEIHIYSNIAKETEVQK